MDEDLISILNELSLTHLIDVFTREKITLAIINELSEEEFQQLGLDDGQRIILKEKCQRRMEIGQPGSEHQIIKRLLESGYNVDSIADHLQLSKRTIFRRLKDMGISARMYSDIDDGNLDEIVHDILLNHPNTGEVMMKGYLKHRGITVPRKDLRNSMRRIL
ncbi:uncharacterized protein LOC117120942 [Anneissia japonica]|uniref:uncharacterized protein LOC117120942 n=1 Tax=Anneissia japonica TaxID=1529436 RepID=UPI0014254E2C|nr:uncharacterized protein LOC117120942 [Anneissia japonica]